MSKKLSEKAITSAAPVIVEPANIFLAILWFNSFKYWFSATKDKLKINRLKNT